MCWVPSSIFFIIEKCVETKNQFIESHSVRSSLMPADLLVLMAFHRKFWQEVFMRFWLSQKCFWRRAQTFIQCTVDPLHSEDLESCRWVAKTSRGEVHQGCLRIGVLLWLHSFSRVYVSDRGIAWLISLSWMKKLCSFKVLPIVCCLLCCQKHSLILAA